MNELEPKELKGDAASKEEGARPNETSVLFEPHVIWGILAFLLIGIWFRFLPLIVISTFLLLLTFVISAWKKHSLRKVEISMELPKSRLFAGEEFQIEAAVFNNKTLPLVWLEWEFPKNKGVILGANEQETYLARFLWLLWFQRLDWTITGLGFKRGVYDLGQVTLRSGDGFRFAEMEKNLNLSDGMLYVYPKLRSVYVPPFRPSMEWGLTGKQGGFIEDPLLINGTREYEAGDELRRFNWRASARTGKLQTNVYQPVVTAQLFIYTDVKGFVIEETADDEESPERQQYIAEKKASFESFLSLVASVAVNYSEQGIGIGYISNSLDNKGNKLAAIDPSVSLTPVLDQLAKSTQHVSTRGMLMLDGLIHQHKLSAPLYIFCDAITEGHYVWFEKNKHRLNEIRFYYRQKSKYADKLAVKAKQMDSYFASSRSALKGV